MEFDNPLNLPIEEEFSSNFEEIYNFHSNTKISERRKMKQNL